MVKTIKRLESFADSYIGWVYPESEQIDIHSLSRAFTLVDDLFKLTDTVYVYPDSSGKYVQFECVYYNGSIDILVKELTINAMVISSGFPFNDYTFNSNKSLLRFLNKILG